MDPMQLFQGGWNELMLRSGSYDEKGNYPVTVHGYLSAFRYRELQLTPPTGRVTALLLSGDERGEIGEGRRKGVEKERWDGWEGKKRGEIKEMS